METKKPTYLEGSLRITVAMDELYRLRDLGEDVLGRETWYDVIAAIACLENVQRDVVDVLMNDNNVFAQE